MARSRWLVVSASVVTALYWLPAASAGAALAGRTMVSSVVGWGKAREVPGLGALNVGGSALLESVSCASARNCSAGGYYTDSGGHAQAFVVSESNGRWGKAREVPGTGALNTGGFAFIYAISCWSRGNCSALGMYLDSPGDRQGFVVGQKNGRWGTARAVPGLAQLNVGGFAVITSVSCGAAGNCSAGGYYRDAHGGFQAWLAAQRKGVWGKAEEVPRSGFLNAGGNAALNSVSCAAAGYCSAGGQYSDRLLRQQAFVVSEVKGTWGKAKEVPWSGHLNAGGSAGIFGVSCASAGNCSAGGYYDDRSHHAQALVVNERKGTWGRALEVPHAGVLNVLGGARVDGISCTAPGYCTAAGQYLDGTAHQQMFVASERKGTWGRATELPGLTSLNTGNTEFGSLSCGAPRDCVVIGSYLDHHDHLQGLFDVESSGVWTRVKGIPGLGLLNAGNTGVPRSVSCGAARFCSAGGYYSDKAGHLQGFVIG
jgi:hypothetical protein